MKRALGGMVDFEKEDKAAALFELRLMIIVVLSVLGAIWIWTAKGNAESYSASCQAYGQWDAQCTGEHGKLRGKQER